MSTGDRLRKQIEFILEIDKLKQIFRQSRITDGTREENDAEHSWHLAMMAILLAEYANDSNINIQKVLKMILIHDIVEIDAGDTFIYDIEYNESKSQREQKAAKRIFGILPPDQEIEFRELWEEFEARNTSEAKFAAAMDRLQPSLLNFKTEGHTWKKFGIKYNRVLQKNEHINEGSQVLWGYFSELLNECLSKGYIIDDN
ncbi:MAG: hypothetical protein APF84_03770 [Gracilibacter sp. BRH_c7a]|nr:MAG: hypothetical protein APF84_03770 [Gracilibacter sp. BRH_c7a]